MRPKPPHSPIPMASLEAAAGALRVLAHPHRLRIVELLDVKEHTVGELAEAMGIPQAACSQHLSTMRASGLLVVERDGRRAMYRIADPRALAVIDCIRRHMGEMAPPPRPLPRRGAAGNTKETGR